MPRQHNLLTSGYHPLAFLLPFLLTKTKLNTKKEREKVISPFQLAYFMHLWFGFSVSPTDVNLPPPTVAPSHTKNKKKIKPNQTKQKSTKDEVTKPRQWFILLTGSKGRFS